MNNSDDVIELRGHHATVFVLVAIIIVLLIIIIAAPKQEIIVDDGAYEDGYTDGLSDADYITDKAQESIDSAIALIKAAEPYGSAYYEDVCDDILDYLYDAASWLEKDNES